MNFYLLFIVFLYVEGCNARVVPLNFKVDKSKQDSSGNELIDESPVDEIEILGQNLPDIEQSKDLELLNSKEDNTTVLDILNRNASNPSSDLVPEEMAVDEESDLESDGSSAISDILEETISSVSEFLSQNNSDSGDSFGAFQVNGTLNDNTKDIKNATSIPNNSSLDLEQGKNLDLEKIEQALNNTLDHSEIAELANTNQNETFVSSEVAKNDHNETLVSFEALNNNQNETSIIFEAVNGTNSTNDFSQMQPLRNETKVETFLSDTENITEKIETNNLTSENLSQTNDSVQTAGGILSGFDFLINSEVARNAAKAMEVFNFSDPLTDHIMEENEFHSFLPAFNPAHDLDSPNQTNVNATAIFTNRSEESSEIRADLNTSLSSINETSESLNQEEAVKIEKNSSETFNLNETLEGKNETELFDLEEKFEGNAASEKTSPLGNSKEKSTLSPPESTILKENITSSVSNSSTVGVPKCPPAGWCIFWFLSQDACAVNEHCLGSRICCKIGCSKTCIEVESLQ